MIQNSANPTTAWLVETLGVARAFDILDAFGCQRVFIPRIGARIRSEFMLALHEDERRHFIERFGGEYVTIPVSREFLCQYLAFVRKEGCSSIARRYRVSRRTVQRSLRRALPFPVSFSASQACSRGNSAEFEAATP